MAIAGQSFLTAFKRGACGSIRFASDPIRSNQIQSDPIRSVELRVQGLFFFG